METQQTHPEIIKVESLDKFYGNTIGVKSVSFSVNRGEIFGFLGPNGAGKTTTIRLLLDLLKPTSGQIQIFGKDIRTDSKEIRSRCGYLPGEFQAYKHLTGYEYLALFSGYRQAQSVDVEQLTDRFRLKKSDMKREISQYSKGMLQKLGIVQAFMHKPELIILDEPTSGLDPLMQEEFYALLAEYHQQGTTFFLSSHNLPEVEKLCSRVSIIRNGEIISTETIKNLRKKTGRVISLELKNITTAPEITGTKLLSADENSFTYKLTGDYNLVLGQIAELPIVDVTIEKPSLEAVFMDFYKTRR